MNDLTSTKMEIQAQREKTILYLTSIAEGLESVSEGKTRFTYREVYNQFYDSVKYLNTYFADEKEIYALVKKLPKLIKPNLLNIQLRSFWVIGVVGALAPYFFLILVAALSPIAFPVILIRFLIILRTKSRAGKANVVFNDIINQLKEKSI